MWATSSPCLHALAHAAPLSGQPFPLAQSPNSSSSCFNTQHQPFFSKAFSDLSFVSSHYPCRFLLAFVTPYYNYMLVYFLPPGQPTMNSLSTGGISYSSLHLQLWYGVWNITCIWYTFVGAYRLPCTPQKQAGCRESQPLPGDSAQWPGWWWCPKCAPPVEQRAVDNREDGTLSPLPSAPSRGESSVCPCSLGFSLPSRGDYSQGRFSSWSHPEQKLLASCGPAAQCPSPPAALVPLLPNGSGVWRLPRKHLVGPLSAGETEPSEFPIWCLRLLELQKRERKWGGGGVACAGRGCQAEAWRCQAPHHFLSLVAPLDVGLACSCELTPCEMRSCSCLVHWLWRAGSRQPPSKAAFVFINLGACAGQEFPTSLNTVSSSPFPRTLTFSHVFRPSPQG